MKTFDVKALKTVYAIALKDITEGVNLDRHLQAVHKAIKDIDMKIEEEEQAGRSVAGLLKIRNEFFYLKYLILEQT